MQSQKLLQEIEQELDKEEIAYLAKLINKNYNLNLSDTELWKIILGVFGNRFAFIINKYQKQLLANEFINELILKYYPGERTIKYHFVNQFRDYSEDIILFEMNANDSRVDLCRVNGKSIAYEIKTELDTMNRLEKQVEDYSKIFEYVYIVTPYSSWDKIMGIIPSYCGALLYTFSEGECCFKEKRKAKKSPNLDSLAQLKNVSSEDLKFMLAELRVNKIPNTRREREDMLVNKCTSNRLNRIFKEALRNKFGKQWRFIQANFDEILPIDVQSFFHQPIDPTLAYFKDSLIV